jgi:NitT/TauT family transport system permease protein
MGRDLNDMSLVLAMMLVIIGVGLVIDQVCFARLESWVRQRWGLAGR